MDVNKVLEAFARGEINKEKARDLIQTLFKEGRGAQRPPSKVGAPAADVPAEPGAGEGAEALKKAFDRIRKSRNIDEFFKASSGIVQQIAGNVPGQIEKLQETYLQDMSIAGLSTNIKGITSKFSLFRSFAVTADCAVSENQAVGCQWFAVSFADGAQVHNNKFTAVQVSEMGVERSNFSGNHLALSRLSNVTLRKARVDNNRLSRSTLSDASVVESDFVENRLSKAEFAQTAIHASRVARNLFSGVTFRECDFDGCDLQGLEFENCTFEECSFLRVEVQAETPVKIADRSLVGVTVQDCKSVEALLAALGAPTAPKTSEVQNKKTRMPRDGEVRVSTSGQVSSRSPSEAATPSGEGSENRGPRKSTSGKAQVSHKKPTEEKMSVRKGRAPGSK